MVLSDHEVKSVPMQRCGSVNIQSCGECVALQDPYCAWNLQSQRCEEHQPQLAASRQLDASSLLQSLYSGLHGGCPTSRHGESHICPTAVSLITFCGGWCGVKQPFI